MAGIKLLAGLFDRPINPISSQVAAPTRALPDPVPLPPRVAPVSIPAAPVTHYVDSSYCVVNPDDPLCYVDGGGGGGTTIIKETPTTTIVTTNNYPAPLSQTIQNTINVTDQGVQSVSDAVTAAIDKASQDAADIAKSTSDTVGTAIGNLANKIWTSVQAAFSNIGDLLTALLSSVWDHLKDIFGAIADNLSAWLKDIKDFLGPILTQVASVLDAVTKQVQLINDTLIKPIADIYNTTIKTITSLTVAIEQDLHDGLSGILKIPSDIANGLGSLDATLDRSITQLGTINKATVTSSIDYLGTVLPHPLSAALASALGGTNTTGQLKTTFSQPIALTSESLSQVSAQAISALGNLLKDILHTIGTTFASSFDQMHADWSSVGGAFTGLLDGILTLLTTVTAVGSLAAPLISVAEQEANTLVPTRKLDPGTVIDAMKRGFINAQQGLAEIKTSGLDATRIQTLIDLSLFLADTNLALDWWYRGFIGDSDLDANLSANGLTPADQDALKASSIYLPTMGDLQRWLNFGIITPSEFADNAHRLRYDDQQIDTILKTYQEFADCSAMADLDGWLASSDASFLDATSKIDPPASVIAAGARQGLHPSAVQYIWDAHWELPSVDTFIENYFRGIRTLTEVQARMRIANIPRELWDDLIVAKRSFIPHRSVPNYISKGWMTVEQGKADLAAQGFDEQHIQIIIASAKPPATPTTTTAATAVHTLSLASARTLWEDGALLDQQYHDLLVAHGYTDALATAQMQADKLAQHVKLTKQTLADYTAQVEAGVLTIDDATSQLYQQGFTAAQVAKFQITVQKSLKTGSKHPSLADLDKFLKAQLISLDQYKSELQLQGWNDPWLTAFLGLVSDPTTGQVAQPGA